MGPQWHNIGNRNGTSLTPSSDQLTGWDWGEHISNQPWQCGVGPSSTPQVSLHMAKTWPDGSSEHPRCATEVEDKAHIMQCISDKATQTWLQSLKWLKQWFWENNTAHKIAEAIIWGLNKWQNLQTENTTLAGEYLKDQEKLGWDLFLDGWLARSWCMHQEGIWHSAYSCWSSKRWVAELIKKIRNMSWDMWAHQNGILHNSAQAKHDILEKQVNDQIWTIYANGTQVVPCNAIGLLRKLLKQILHLPFTMKQQWLDSIASAIARKQQHDYGCYLGEQCFMATWVIKKWDQE